MLIAPSAACPGAAMEGARINPATNAGARPLSPVIIPVRPFGGWAVFDSKAPGFAPPPHDGFAFLVASLQAACNPVDRRPAAASAVAWTIVRRPGLELMGT